MADLISDGGDVADLGLTLCDQGDCVPLRALSLAGGAADAYEVVTGCWGDVWSAECRNVALSTGLDIILSTNPVGAGVVVVKNVGLPAIAMILNELFAQTPDFQPIVTDNTYELRVNTGDPDSNGSATYGYGNSQPMLCTSGIPAGGGVC